MAFVRASSMELISAVNEQIMKAFELVIPPALQNHCCLIVLGSEGRGEQILKTDQDNALIIQDGLNWHQCQSAMNDLTHALRQLGYPLCPGNVMVNSEMGSFTTRVETNSHSLGKKSNARYRDGYCHRRPMHMPLRVTK